MADLIDLNTVQVVNSNEIFQYQPKRKIEIINDNNELSLYDKNFTYVISFHPISPYTFPSTIGENFLQATDMTCPHEFVNHDSHYLNLDAFDWWEDSTNSFYPLLSLDGTCKYDGTSLEECEFYNCFVVFLYKGELHQVVNDGVSQPAKVHCKIDIGNIKESYHKWYHLILTRNDNIWMMQLVLDEYSLFSIDRPEIVNSIPNDRRFINSNKITINEPVDNILELNTEYNLPIGYNENYELVFSLEKKSDIVLEIFIDEFYKFLTTYYVQTHQQLPETYGPLPDVQYPFNPVYWELVDFNDNKITNIDSNNTQYDNYTRYFSLENLEAGVYKIYINIPSSTYHMDYSKVVFTDDREQYSNTEFISVKVHEKNKFDIKKQNQNNNRKTSYISLLENINVSDCVSVDATICIGYLERWPMNIITDNKLYKNSFKGYISEFSFFRDQSYFRKFNTFNNYEAFNYITEYDSNETIKRIPAYEKYENPAFNPEVPYLEESIQTKKIINNNNVPFISNQYNNTTNFTSAQIGGRYEELDEFYSPEIHGELNIVSPKSNYITNFLVDDIILIDDNIVKNINNENDKKYISNKVTHQEFPNIIDESSDAIYHGNNITTSDNPTFCIFTFDIIKNINDLTKTEIYDQVRFLMRSDYTQEEYNENKTYSEYIIDDLTHGYIRPENFSRYNQIKSNILNKINDYTKNIYNETTKLYITKFVINCFRDSRYMFIYNIRENLTHLDKRNSFDNYVTVPYISTYKSDQFFSYFVSPFYTNYKYIYQNNYKFGRFFNYDFMTDSTGDLTDYTHIIINGFYYSNKESNFGGSTSRSLILGYSLDLFEDDLIPLTSSIIKRIGDPVVQTPSYYSFEFEGLDFDTIQIIDKSGTVYREMDFIDFQAHYELDANFENILLTDSTIQEPFIYDINMLYYINLNTSKNNNTYIIKQFNLFEGSTLNLKQNYNVIKLDSTSYQINYDNQKMTDRTQTLIKVNQINEEINASSLYENIYKQKIALATSIDFNLYEIDQYFYPSIKVETPSEFEVEYNNLFDQKWVCKFQLPKNENVIFLNNELTSNLFFNITQYFKYNTFIIDDLPRTLDFFKYKTTTNFIDKYQTNMFSKMNITYEGTKRIISPII